MIALSYGSVVALGVVAFFFGVSAGMLVADILENKK